MFNQDQFPFTLVLASGSPRRQQFFRDMGLPFELRIREVEETFSPELFGVEITQYLSELKANAHHDLAENELLITSDTIVWHQQKALGKPKDRSEAIQMLGELSGSTHEVITSVCLKTAEKTQFIHDITKVRFTELSPSMIAFYVDQFQPLDKAGAYGIQEWSGFVGIESIEGSYTNVVGLPTQKVYQAILEMMEE
ncbi:MAG: septum formation protein Maf [Flavobacterium sp. BFFFF2]|nr:MAG: septum formation protein Maf [Flavobacterium sp. BFFFF2]